MNPLVGVVPLYVGTNQRGKQQRVSTLCVQYKRKSTFVLLGSCEKMQVRKKTYKKRKEKKRKSVCNGARREGKRKSRKKGFAFFTSIRD
jgi:hypothetical protein